MAESMQQSSKFLVRIRSDFRQFLQHAEKFMMENEAMNNLLWEVGKAIEKKGSKSEVFLTVERNDRVCLAGIISGTGYLILASGDIEASEELSKFLSEKNFDLNGVTGCKETGNGFARHWGNRTGKRITETANLKVFFRSLEKKSYPECIESGNMRKAEESDVDLVREWCIGFAAESKAVMDPTQLIEWAKAIVDAGDMFFWEEEQTVSMASFGRSTPNGLVINMVYTPARFRGKGFAKSLMMALANEAQSRGAKFCCLFSEYGGKANLYESVGFERIGQFNELSFRD